MVTYDWALIERLLHEVQNGSGKNFASSTCAQEHAAAQAATGQPIGTLMELENQADGYEALLLSRGFIERRPEEEGGNGENFILTPRGSSLLSLIDSSIPGNEHPLQVLNEQTDALAPEIFDTLAAKVQIA